MEDAFIPCCNCVQEKKFLCTPFTAADRRDSYSFMKPHAPSALQGKFTVTTDTSVAVKRRGETSDLIADAKLPIGSGAGRSVSLRSNLKASVEPACSLAVA